MNILSTTEKGNIFENEVFNFICSYVNNGETFLNPQKCQFFKKKGYYSNARKKDIIVDVSIESHINSIDKIALLTIIECKNNTTRNVPVDDIEEFESKINQISGKNVKGMMFSKSGFSSGAYEFAKSKKIALARLLPYDKVDWILERTPKPIEKSKRGVEKNKEIIKALTKNDYIGKSESFFSMYNSSLSNYFPNFFNSLISKNYNKKRNSLNKKYKSYVPFLGQEEIELKVEKLITFFTFEVVDNGYEINLIKILDYLCKSHQVSYDFESYLGLNSQGNEILGKFELNHRKIYITNTLQKHTPRWRFTLAHEIAHLLLHRNLSLSSFDIDHMDTEEIINWIKPKNKVYNNLGRLEWQANSFASSLLLPRELVYNIITLKIDELDIRKFNNGIIYLDEQRCNIQTYQNILFSMKNKFNVSYQVINYRLAQLGLLNNQTKQKHISDILKEDFFSFSQQYC